MQDTIYKSTGFSINNGSHLIFIISKIQIKEH